MARSPDDNAAAAAGAPADTPSTSNSQAAQSTQPTHLRSCVLCRQRKVKCDRRQPCSNCIRAGSNCVHPPGAGRAAKRPRQAVDTKVLDRLSHLETTIRRLQQQAKSREAESQIASESASEHALSAEPQARERKSPVDDASQETEAVPELGRLVVEESQSRYVSNVMWADLTEEIEQLRGMFLDFSSKDDDSTQLDDSPPLHDDENPTLGSLSTNAAILGYRSLAHSLRDFYPSTELSMKLFQLFTENVLPLVRIFHTTSLIRLFWAAAATTDPLDKETEALLFAIYYSAVISIDPVQCANVLGEPRPVVVERYRFATEQALARANLLNTQSTILLQAAILYVSVLRSDDGTRTVWSLIALICHVARSMGFHRDGTAFNLSPFESEMRRRIWHQVCLIDHRSTEYHGYEPIVFEETAFDTRWPLNVNDSDLSSDMTELPPESDDATDMTLVHVRCHALEISYKMKRASRSSFQTRVKIMDEHDKWVEKYVERCDISQPLHYLAKQICYIASRRVRTLMYYTELKSRKQKGEVNASHTSNAARNVEGSGYGGPEFEMDSKTLRDHIFVNSVDILKRTADIMQDSRIGQWTWHLQIYVQWHTLALALSEICIRPPSLLCDAAWEYANTVYDTWLLIKFRDSTERGDDFVKPIGQLIARARHVRETQQAEKQQKQQQQPQRQPHRQTPAEISRPGTGDWVMREQPMSCDTPESATSPKFDDIDATRLNLESRPAALNPVTVATTASSNLSPNDPPMYDIGDFDSFLEMMPDELHNEWFESPTPGNPNPSNHTLETMPTMHFFDSL
ncbi:fungal-specific transcription factor domain-containing protein [Xylaria sp. FL1042]|nr:fungal-specific transcription factor domain-containing protein [Xylaria sp. FL1042]